MTEAIPSNYASMALARATPRAKNAGKYRLGFILFLLVNAVLFIRPAEIFPSIEAVPIYEMLMIAALVASAGAIVRLFTSTPLREQPMTACVLVMLVAVVLSHLSHGSLYLAKVNAVDYLKVVLYFMMLVSLVDSLPRLTIFMQVTAVYIFAIAALALLHYHGLIELQALEALAQLEQYNEDLGSRVVTIRLQASGIFNDPNDFALILTAGLLVVAHLFLESKRLLARVAYLVPLGVYLYALALTRSRGGFLAMSFGVMAMLVSRLGWKRGLQIGAIGLPVMLVAFGGRQTNLNFDEGDTGHGRVEIWRDAIVMFAHAPLFGAGKGEMLEQVGIVAHNSFLHSYAELGLFGGTAFLGLFYIPLTRLRRANVVLGGQHCEGPGEPAGPAKVLPGFRFPISRLRRDEQASKNYDNPLGLGRPVTIPGHFQISPTDTRRVTFSPDEPVTESSSAAGSPGPTALWRLRNCVLPVTCAYAIGLCSLSRGYVVPTYLILGIAASYMGLARQHGMLLPPPGMLLPRLVKASLGFLACLYIFVVIVTR
jgi:O-antigen ligase